ncbi:gluconate 2-dehydrogenase subunit 3 family protein [Ramlibacter sp.]|uniref:gluconate 2-dehydrogenase subunit 3 family protein n=1 Tax=Ramlibacter sp. TaxID=1917967 RepID=UPI00261009E7|nr:gluconate 2-dehydrogenase subunit 3 family protein [Ramlibacter sp.]MDB5955224.1 hypothetical protein [Ramlibacter sp.]
MTERHAGQRRGFLKQVVGATGSLPLVQALAIAGTATGSAQAVAATPSAPAATPQVGYLCFGQDEAAFVEALVNVMCPADAYTPNGVDCGLAVFMDRQLAGAFGRGAKRYMQGPGWPASRSTATLFVVGASVFPHNAGYNPTGPLAAMALRVGDDIASYVERPRVL